MAIKIRKILAMLVFLCVMVSVIPMQALAAGDEGTSPADAAIDVVISIPETVPVTVEGKDGAELTVEADVKSTVTEGENTTDVNVSINDNETVDGNKVHYKADADVTIDNESGEVLSGAATEEYTVKNGNYTANGGSETTFAADPEGLAGKTVDVPLEEGESNTVLGDAEEGEVISQTGDLPKNENDGTYDYTTTTVTQQGSVTVETTDVTLEENVSDKTDLEYVKSETNPTDSNDLSHVGQAPEEFLPGYEGETVIPEGVEGYDYVYVGSGNSSKYFPAIAFDRAMTDEEKLAMYGENAYLKKGSKAVTNYYIRWLKEEVKNSIAYDENGDYVTDENGYILDVNGNRIFKEERTEVGPNGETTYLHRFDNYGSALKVEGWYEDGEWVKELNGEDGYYAIWAGPQQFVLVDGEGNIITTYCADFTTPTQDNFGYNVENLEDADYYSEEEAKMIRSIATNGYWGTTIEKDEDGNPILDENGNEIPALGSLDAMKAALKAAGFTDEELASLNDGVALTATQMAIWSCSNKMYGIEFVNAHYSNWGTGDVPADKEDEVKLLFKLYDYLMNLDPTETEGTTADTIINKDNFVDDMAVTVVKKAEDHANNKDKDKDNDAYYVNLSFALVVEPSTERGDDLVVKIVSGGQEIAVGRVAGELKDGEIQLTKGEDDNYTFTNIVLTEGNQTFNLSLEGIQNLDEGVYLYSSEIRVDNDQDVSSQTLVGLAGGERGVDVSMAVSFDFNVEDQIVAKERVYRAERTNPIPSRTTPPPTTIDDDPVPLSDDGLIEILDEEVPLADAPETGDNSIIWLMMSLVSGLALCVIILSKKQCKA